MLNGKVGKVEKLEATVAQQQKQIGQEQKQIETLTAQLREQAETFTAQLKEQATQIQKVSAQLAAASPSRGGLEVSKPAPQVANNP
jgi:septal ring factor EnvC (AmiA/AmiB activator)